jgi:predicted exporter
VSSPIARVSAWLAVSAALAATIALQWRLETGIGIFAAGGDGLAQDIVTEQLEGSSGLSRLLLVRVAGDDPLAAAARLSEAYAALPDVALAASGPGAELLGGADTLFQYRYLLSNRVEQDLFATTRLRETLQTLAAELRRPVPTVDEERAAADPTGEMRYLLRQWFGGSSTGRNGQWQTRGGGGVLLVRPASGAFDTQAQADLIDALRRTAADVVPHADVTITGPPAIAVAVRDAVRSDAQWVSAIAVAGVALLLLVVLRRPRALVYTTLPVATGVLAATAAVVTAFGSIHGITLGFGGMLLGVTVDYPLHLLGHARRVTLRQAIRAVRGRLLIGAGSTALGLLAMALAGITGLQQVALFAATGIAAALATTLWLLPALPWRPDGGAWSVGSRGRSPRWLAAGFIAACLAGGAWALTQLQLDGDLTSLSPLPRDLAQLDGRLRQALDLPEPRYLLALQGSERDALAASARVAERLAALRREGAIDRYRAITDIIPPRRVQTRRRQALPDRPELTRRVKEASAGAGINADALTPFINAVDRSRALEWLRPSRIDDGLAGDWLRGLFRQQGDEWVSLIRLTGVNDPDAVGDAAADVASGDIRVIALDVRAEIEAMVTEYQRRAAVYSLLGLGLMLILVAAGTRSLRRCVHAVGVIASGLGAALSLVALIGAPITLFHLCSFLLIAGLGLDYALFTRGDGPGRATVTLCAVSSMIAFGVMASAATPVLHAIGVTVVAGVAGAWISAVLLHQSASARTAH